MLSIVSRAQWGATAGLGPAMRLPVGECNLHHSVTALSADPVRDMRTVERIGVQRFGRFSYSWAYHRPSRSLLEGAGDTIGAHTANRNSTSLGLVLIGNYDGSDRLDDTAVADLGQALRWLIDTGRLREDFALRGHRDHKATACPGRHAYARIPEIRAAVSAPTPTSEEDDDMAAHVEQIRTAYKRVRGRDYDPATSDNAGWTHWMRSLGDAPDRAAAKAIVQQAEALLFLEAAAKAKR